MTDELVAFLRARLDEDEQWAREVQERFLQDHGSHALIIEGAAGMWSTVNVAARVLREVEAKRRIIDEHAPVDPCDAHDAELRSVPCDTLRLLALPYADHDEYREEWKP